MERRQVLVDAVDQACVDRLRDVRAVQRGLERRRVVPRPRVENIGLDLRVQRGAERAAIAAERAEERRHHFLPILAVRRHARDAEGGAVELDLLPVGERHRGVREVGVREHAEDVRWSRGDHRRGGEQLLLRICLGVRPAALDVVEIEAERLEPRLARNEAIDRRAIGLQDLRLDECRLAAELRVHLHHFLLHALVLADARVLVRQHAGVDVGPRELLVQLRQQLERVGESPRRGAERAAKALQLRNLGEQALFSRPPGLLRRIDVRGVPLVLVGNLAAVAFLREPAASGRTEAIAAASAKRVKT